MEYKNPIHGIILIRDNLQRKGWRGPGSCVLCNQAEENIQHLFKKYKYTPMVHSKLKDKYAVRTWGRETNETKNIREKCRNKTRGIVIAALFWHI